MRINAMLITVITSSYGTKAADAINEIINSPGVESRLRRLP